MLCFDCLSPIIYPDCLSTTPTIEIVFPFEGPHSENNDSLRLYAVNVLTRRKGVATPGAVYQKLATSLDDPRRERMEMMAKAVLLLATEPLDKITGRVTYSQQILKEFGWIDKGEGVGIDLPGSGFSQI